MLQGDHEPLSTFIIHLIFLISELVSVYLMLFCIISTCNDKQIIAHMNCYFNKNNVSQLFIIIIYHKQQQSHTTLHTMYNK